MMLSDIYHIPTALSLGLIAVVLAVAVVASIVRARRLAERFAGPGAQARGEVGEEITSKT